MNSFIDLQKLLREIKFRISRNNDGDLRTGTDPANTEAPFLSNKALHSLFSDCISSANCVQISSTKRKLYDMPKAFLEKEISSKKTAKNT